MPYLQGKTKLSPDDELIPFTQALEDGPFTSVLPLLGVGSMYHVLSELSTLVHQSICAHF